jgi:5-methylcytosine-specific restriction protein A
VRVCNEPGCPSLSNGPKCEAHRKARRKASDAKRPSSSQRGYDSKWRKTRAAYLRAHPICEDETGCIERATDVDHRDGLGPLGPRGHDDSNLRSYCHSHHSKRTATDQPGGFNA